MVEYESRFSEPVDFNGRKVMLCHMCEEPVLDSEGNPLPPDQAPAQEVKERITENRPVSNIPLEQDIENIKQETINYHNKTKEDLISYLNKFIENINEYCHYIDHGSRISVEQYENGNWENVENQPKFKYRYWTFPAHFSRITDTFDIRNSIQSLANKNKSVYSYLLKNEIGKKIDLLSFINNVYKSIISNNNLGSDFYGDEDIFNNKQEVINAVKKAGKEIIQEFDKNCQEFFMFWQTMDQFKNLVETQTYEVSIIAPICPKCYEEHAIHCHEEGCNFTSMDSDEFTDIKEREWSTQVGRYITTGTFSYCKDHGADCEHCGKGLRKEDDETIHYERSWYHSDCFHEVYSSCEECGRTVYSEDIMWDDETSTALCQECYQENSQKQEGIDQSVEREDLEVAESLANSYPKYLPIDEKLIIGSIIPNIMAAQKKFKDEDPKGIQFVLDRLQKPEAKAAVVTIMRSVDGLQEMLDYFKGNAQEINRFKQEYPGLKGFKPFPVAFRVERARIGHGGWVFAIYPSKETLQFADQMVKFGTEAYDSYLKFRGHHPGALGYARFSLSNGAIVVDNLQTDLDAQAIEIDSAPSDVKPALQWWLSNIRKYWAPILLDMLKKYGQSINKPVYLTSFDMQKEKWQRIPDRNKDIYDRLPEIMGFEEEEVQVKPEDLIEQDWTMRRIAKEINNLCSQYLKYSTL